MKISRPDRKDLVGAALIAAAATGAAGNTEGADILFEGADLSLDQIDTHTDIGLVLGDLSALDTPDLFDGSFLVAEQHDGTWVGGGGKDVISTGDRPRTFRDRLTRGNVLGGMAATGLAVLAWLAFRRRKQ